jgi:hypothetical protein
VSSAWDQVAPAAARADLALLDDQELADLVEAIAERYLAGRQSLWWWNNLKVPSKTVVYGKEDGLALLRDLLPERTDLVLVVTDEAVAPSGAARGNAAHLVQLLRDCWGFEFALVPGDLAWIVFDTHHNALVIAGRLGTVGTYRERPGAGAPIRPGRRLARRA